MSSTAPARARTRRGLGWALVLLLASIPLAEALPLDPVGASTQAGNGPGRGRDPLPDLHLVSLRIGPEDARAGDPVTVHATVENRGGAASGSFTVNLVLNGTHLLAEENVTALAPGEGTTVSFTWRPGPGAHRVDVVADPDERVPERHENNNAKGRTVTFDARKLPDLAVTALHAEPSDPAPGDPVHLTARIENLGDAEAPATRVLWARNDGTALDLNETPVLPAGEAVVMNFTWTAAEGEHTVTLEADPDQDLQEGNETNNLRALVLIVSPAETDPAPPEGEPTESNPTPPGDPAPTPAADLAVNDTHVTPGDPHEGEAALFQARVTNLGDAHAAAFIVRFQVAGAPVGEDVRVHGLAPGRSVVLETRSPWSGGIGGHEITVTADTTDEVSEGNESNNAATLAFEVRPAPDLAVRILRIDGSPAPVPEDAGAVLPGRIEVEVEACNAGAGPLEDGNVTLRATARAGDAPTSRHLGTQRLGTLDPDACTRWTVTWDAHDAAGEVRVLAEGDAARFELDHVPSRDTRRVTFVAGGHGGTLVSGWLP